MVQIASATTLDNIIIDFLVSRNGCKNKRIRLFNPSSTTIDTFNLQMLCTICDFIKVVSFVFAFRYDANINKYWQKTCLWNILDPLIWFHCMCRFSHVPTVYPKKYAHGFVVLCFVVVMQSFIMNSHEVFIHIHQGCFAGTGAIVRLPQCQWSKPGGYGKISQCITTTKHSKAKTVCIFLGIYCTLWSTLK